MTIVKCPECKRDVEIKQKINRCECGVRIKIIDWSGKDE